MNMNKLRGKIVENGLSVDKLSDAMGVDRSTVYRKINDNGESFTVREVRKIVSVLSLTPEEIGLIFFNDTVA